MGAVREPPLHPEMQNGIISIARRCAREVAREFQPERVVLFGSHVSGGANEDSDIDVAVVFNQFTSDALAASARLCGLTRRVGTLIEPIYTKNSGCRLSAVPPPW